MLVEIAASNWPPASGAVGSTDSVAITPHRRDDRGDLSPEQHAQLEVCRHWDFGLLGLVSDARGRDHGSMKATATISSAEGACSCYRWEVPDGYNVAAHAFASCYITGRGWVLNGSREM